MPLTHIPGFIELTRKVRRVDREAADYLLSDEFAESAKPYMPWRQPLSLILMFTWSDTPQGHMYWSRIDAKIS